MIRKPLKEQSSAISLNSLKYLLLISLIFIEFKIIYLEFFSDLTYDSHFKTYNFRTNKCAFLLIITIVTFLTEPLNNIDSCLVDAALDLIHAFDLRHLCCCRFLPRLTLLSSSISLPLYRLQSNFLI